MPWAYDERKRTMARSFIIETKDIDKALALFFVFLAAFGAYTAFIRSDPISQAQALAPMPVNIAAAYAFAVRAKPSGTTYLKEAAVPFLSFLFPTLILNLGLIVPTPYGLEWTWVVAVPGIVLSVLSVWYLRKCFSVLPAFRGVVDNGPYAIVRHPLYLGETLYLAGIVLLRFSALGLVAFIAGLVLLAWRIRIEEHKLLFEPEYRTYAAKVRYRFIPYIY